MASLPLCLLLRWEGWGKKEAKKNTVIQPALFPDMGRVESTSRVFYLARDLFCSYTRKVFVVLAPVCHEVFVFADLLCEKCEGQQEVVKLLKDPKLAGTEKVLKWKTILF